MVSIHPGNQLLSLPSWFLLFLYCHIQAQCATSPVQLSVYKPPLIKDVPSILVNRTDLLCLFLALQYWQQVVEKRREGSVKRSRALEYASTGGSPWWHHRHDNDIWRRRPSYSLVPRLWTCTRFRSGNETSAFAIHFRSFPNNYLAWLFKRP